jgi:phosphoglycerate dehydrogenase-like enzyme
MRIPKALYILDADAFPRVYGAAERADVARQVEVSAPPQTAKSIRARPDLLADVEVILSGWGGPVLDAAFLDAAPRLEAFFYAAGAMSGVLTPAVWDRSLVVSSALEANAVPVAEYALSTILFSLKHGWRLARETRQRRAFPDRNDGVPGCFGSTVGLISVGAVGRALLRLLKPFDLRVLAYDPFLDAGAARRLGVSELVGLDELFARADVASLHTPLFPETAGMITGGHLSALRRGATFINTARGELVRQDELVAVARRRPDLQFVLDVATPEPPAVDSPLYDLPNVVLTPHIAGSAGGECRRLGRFMVEELERHLSGQPLRWPVTPDLARWTSHRPGMLRPPGLAEAAGSPPLSAAVAV